MVVCSVQYISYGNGFLITKYLGSISSSTKINSCSKHEDIKKYGLQHRYQKLTFLYIFTDLLRNFSLLCKMIFVIAKIWTCVIDSVR